ncbi:hypothetical protein VV02_04810 [Luteipulveratus mongoliensis]|uniref:Uncharacterized protein n=1 Tax=Luteipulveratus mongoliensis TaxID=571913 RepID=A0A0K1JF53_9MICO|nr:hypothetical protein VV02_04810 [Luteipulveratus mongoliensis]
MLGVLALLFVVAAVAAVAVPLGLVLVAIVYAGTAGLTDSERDRTPRPGPSVGALAFGWLAGPVLVWCAIWVSAHLNLAWPHELIESWPPFALACLAAAGVSTLIVTRHATPGTLWLSAFAIGPAATAVVCLGWTVYSSTSGAQEQVRSPNGTYTAVVSYSGFLDPDWVVSVRSGSGWLGHEFFVRCGSGDDIAGAPTINWGRNNTLLLDGESVLLSDSGKPADPTSTCMSHGSTATILTARSPR